MIALVAVIVLGVLTWYFVLKHPWPRRHGSKLVGTIALLLVALLGVAVRSARIAITRDGVRWGWSVLGFHQSASKIVVAHIYRDGVALEAKRGAWWFLAARDWDRFDALVRQLRRAELPITDHDRKAPLRARLQSYGRFLDGMLVLVIAGACVLALWAA
jgi:hypothetical protein